MDVERIEETTTGAPASARRSAWHTGIIAFVLLSCGAVMLQMTVSKPPPLPFTGGVVGEFSLTDQEGRKFASSALRGRVWVASFVFTNCRDTCPCISANMLVLQDALQANPILSASARLVSFSVDPERDRPQDLKAYAQRYGADTRLWVFLTGAPGVVAKLAEVMFSLPVGQADVKDGAGAAPEIVHSDRLTLVDGAGRIRGYYHPVAEEVKRLAGDIGRLVKELKDPPGAP